MSARLTELQRHVLSDIERMTYWGGYYATSRNVWNVVKRLQRRRLVKRVDRCKNWADQFWQTTEAGSLAVSSTEQS